MHSRTKQSNRSRQNNYRCLNNTPDGIWASQLISRLFQGTSMLAHYCNNWKPAAEACLSQGAGYMQQPNPRKIQCQDAYFYDRFREQFF